MPVILVCLWGFKVAQVFPLHFYGMIGLRCKYGMITQEEVYDYLVEHCEDMGTEGWNPELDMDYQFY